MKNLFRKIFPSKEVRAYRKMHRRHRKELIKLAEETREWDWFWMHDSMIMQIRHMHEYYTAGNNVWQCDESRLPIIEQLQHVLDLEAEIKKMQDDDFGAVYTWHKREQELYEELYLYIAKNMKHWWD